MNDREKALECMVIAIDGAQDSGMHLEEFLAAAIETWPLVNNVWLETPIHD